jgi:hypothetical protein
MSVIVVVGAILVTTASLNSLWDRRRHDSLERHEKALAALRDLAEHPRELPPEPPPPTPTDHVHILSEPPADAAAHHRRVQKAAAARRAAERRRPRDVSTRPTAAQLPTMPTRGTPAPTPTPAPEPAPQKVTADTMPVVIDPPPRPGPTAVPAAAGQTVATRHVPARVIGAGAAALLVIVAITTAAVVGGRSGSPKRATAAVAPTSVPVAAPAPKPTVAPTPPPDIQVVASAQGNGTVTVTVPYTLTLTASGLCWVSVTSDSGQTLYEGTLQPGQQQHVTGSGPLTVRLGNTPAVQISVNGRPLVLAGVAKTANVRFMPPA